MDLALAELKRLKEDFISREKGISRRVIVCAGTGCLVKGALKIYEEFRKAIGASGLTV